MATVVEQSQRRLLAIDCKSLRGSCDQDWEKGGLGHLVSAFASANCQTLAQLKTDSRGKKLDAIGSQKMIARRITDAGGD